MPFLMDVTITEFGKELEFSNAFHEVSRITATHSSTNCTLEIYEDSSKRNFLGNRFFTFPTDMRFNAPQSFQQSYNYILGLDEFAEAILVSEII
ncbi:MULTISPECIES: hypothetical protein [Bacillaceae]|uniref:Uncharacterized protein n=1 Tax=Alkalicoccobacillus plakortidis TaxID=444060 RepID=A0A9D5DNC3_9BACI|nr:MULTISPECIES: hypothetical protein [Bacillaceae]KQL57241.1 hypothetical protein AN965_09845 [Alkalicoccobacillus plakortidis]